MDKKVNASGAAAINTAPIKPKKKGLTDYEKQKTIFGYVFVAPLLFGFIFFYGEILLNALYFSLTKFNSTGNGYELLPLIGSGEKWGLFNNYHYIFLEQNGIIESIFKSIGSMLIDIPLIIIFSLFIATILAGKIPGRGIFRAIFFIPAVLVTGVIIESTLNNALYSSMTGLSGISAGGISNEMLSISDMEELLGEIVFSSKVFSYIMTAVNNIFDVVNKCGVQILIFISALLGISPSIYESAKIEGASGWDCYWKITIPMIGPMIYVNIIYTIVDSLCAADNAIMSIVAQFRVSVRYDYAAAVSIVYFGLIALIIGIVSLVMNKLVFYQTND